MLSLAIGMLRFRKGAFAATFAALAAGAAILMTCALLAESGLRERPAPQRYAATAAVLAHRDMTLRQKTLGETESTTLAFPERGSVPASLEQRAARLPGVAEAVGDRWIPVALPAAPDAPDAAAHGWSAAALGPYRVTAGTAPRADDEIAVDTALAAAAGLRPGDRTEIAAGGGTHPVRVTALVEPPADGPQRAVFLTDARAAALDPRPGRYDAIGLLAEPGADRDTLVRAARALADDAGITAYTGDDTALAEDPGAAAGRSLAVQAGGAFAGYTAIVLGFVAASTVGLSVRHRRRDLALMRAVGATPGQVRGLVLAEAGLLSLAACAVGVPAGLLAARALRAELVDRGFLPEGFRLVDLPLSVPAVLAAVTLVALGSAGVAALRTSRVRPTEALGEAAADTAPPGRVRLVAGVLALAAAVSLTGVTGAADGDLALGAAVSMLYSFVLATALLAPWINHGAARLLGPVLRALFGDSGHLAAAHLKAHARGTVAVLTALVLAVGLGSTVWFLQDNLRHQTGVQLRDGVRAQFVVTGGAGLPASAAERARGLPGVEAAAGTRRTAVLVSGGLEPRTVPAQGVDPTGADRVLDLGVRSGSLGDLRGKDTVAVSSSLASSAGWRVGDTARLWLGDGTPVRPRVVAVYDRGFGFGDVTLPTAALTGHTVSGLDDRVLVRARPGAERDVQRALGKLAAEHPGSFVVPTDGLAASVDRELEVSGWLNRTLVLVLAAFAALAAADTLVLATLARTRELSLLRLAGVTRRQVVRMVYAEQTALMGVALAVGGTICAVTLSLVVHAVTGTAVPHVPWQGWAVVVGGAAGLALLAVRLPLSRVLRVAPVRGAGVRE